MNMKGVKGLLLTLVMLTLALTAAPAAAQRGREEWSRRGHREERVERGRWNHGRWVHERWGHRRRRHRQFAFVYPAPYAAPSCYRRAGHWAWDGWQYVWVRPRMVCR